MKYKYKATFNDAYTISSENGYEGGPYLSDAVVYDCTSSEDRLTIGGTVSNKLVVNLHNAPVTNFDGAKMVLQIAELVESGDSAEDVTLTGITDAQTFIDDMTTITDEAVGDTGEDVTLVNIEAIAEDEDSVTETFQDDVTTESGDNSEVPTNDNKRDDRTSASGGSSTDTGDVDEWIDFGTYYITDVVKVDDTTYQLTALDGFILMGGVYEPAIESGSIADYYDDFTSQLADLGIEVNDETFADVDLDWSSVYTFRESAGFFASLNGGYACFGREGYLDIRAYLQGDTGIEVGDLQSREVTENPIYINAVSCDRDVSLSNENIITAGEDDTIEMAFTNPFMTEDMLADVLAIYQYILYQPCAITCKYRAEFQSGDFINVRYDDDGNEELICITNQTISLDTGLTKIESLGNSATLATNEQVSPTVKKILAEAAASNAYTDEKTGEVSAEVSAVRETAENAVPMTNDNGTIEWVDNALRIDSHDNSQENFYETEIGGSGIRFRYAQSAEQVRTDSAVVAEVNQQYLKIRKTVVLDEMVIGEWVWQARSDGRLELKWKGSDS